MLPRTLLRRSFVLSRVLWSCRQRGILRRQEAIDLDQTSRDLTVKRQLLELGEGQVAETVMSVHEFGLVVDYVQVDMLVFLKHVIDVKGKRSHPCGFLFFLVSFP